MEITFEQLKPLIESEIWDGNIVNLKFKAYNQEAATETMGYVAINQDDVMKKMMEEVAKSAASGMVINTAANGIGGLIGVSGGSLSGLASKAGIGYQTDMNKITNTKISEELKQSTIINAFKNLMAYYELKDGKILYKTPA